MPNKILNRKIHAQVANKKLVEARHKQIFTAAIKLFSDRGFQSTTMRGIASTAGINLSQLYNYISSKDDILYLFYKHSYAQWMHFYDRLEDEEKDTVELLKDLVKSMLQYAHNKPKEILTLYTETRHLKHDYLHSVLDAESAMIKKLEYFIKRGTKEGVFRVNDPFIIANIIQYLIVIEALRGWSIMEKYTFNKYANLITDIILDLVGVKNKQKD